MSAGAGRPTDADVLSEFLMCVMQAAGDANRKLTGKRSLRNGSQCAAWAVEAGLPVQMAYSVAQTSRYTGMSVGTLMAEVHSGRLAAVLPAGCEKGYRIPVAEMDRWVEENTCGGRP